MTQYVSLRLGSDAPGGRATLHSLLSSLWLDGLAYESVDINLTLSIIAIAKHVIMLHSILPPRVMSLILNRCKKKTTVLNTLVTMTMTSDVENSKN